MKHLTHCWESYEGLINVCCHYYLSEKNQDSMSLKIFSHFKIVIIKVFYFLDVGHALFFKFNGNKDTFYVLTLIKSIKSKLILGCHFCCCCFLLVEHKYLFCIVWV